MPKKTSKKAENELNYYKLDRIIRENADYNLIIGERGNGKTYAIQEFVINEYLKSGRQFFLLRRWVDDVKPSNAQNFIDGNLIARLPELTDGEFTNVVYRTSRYILVSYDEKGKPIIDDRNVIGFVWDINEQERLKGQSFPGVKDIIFEEFISLSSEGYIPDEITYFLNVLSTIIRDKTDVRIWMLGNTVNPYNPYFKHFGIKGLELKQGEIFTKYDSEYGCKVAIEFCQKRRKGSLQGTSAKYYGFGSKSGAGDMITSGVWQSPDYPTRKFNPKLSVYKLFINFDDKRFELHILNDGKNPYLYCLEVPNKVNIDKSHICLDLNPSQKMNYYTSILNVPDNRLPTDLKLMMANSKIWFDSKMTGQYYNNFMKQSTRDRIFI